MTKPLTESQIKNRAMLREVEWKMQVKADPMKQVRLQEAAAYALNKHNKRKRKLALGLWAVIGAVMVGVIGLWVAL